MKDAAPETGAEGTPIDHEGPVATLLRLSAPARFSRSTDGRFDAQVRVGGRPEIDFLKSSAFHDRLIDGFSRARGEVPSDWAMRRALAALEARSPFQGGKPQVFIRVGQDEDADCKQSSSGSYLELGDPRGQAVKIRIAPLMRLHGISVMFERTRNRCFITITKSDRPESAASPNVSGSHIEKSVDNLIGRTKTSFTRNSLASKAVTLVTLNRAFSHNLCVARPSV
jgi:hypothetical protein